MPTSGAWRSRWLFSLTLGLAACDGGGAESPLDGEQLDPRVLAHIQQRDELEPADAEQRARDTVRLAAASRQAQADSPGEPQDQLSSARRQQLLRTSRARLWLKTDFEPKHRREDIPEQVLAQARAMPKYAHPALHAVCQIVVKPEGDSSPDEVREITKGRSWRDQASALLEPTRRHMLATVNPGDPKPCELIGRLMEFHPRERDGLVMRFEGLGGFELDACVERAADGTCESPAYAAEWVEPVSQAEPPGFLEPFFSRFGLHLVFVKEILPERSPEQPDHDDYLRSEVHPTWQKQAFAAYMERLRQARVVRIAASAGNEPSP